MANVPLAYKISFYDPSVPTGVITAQENNANAAVRLDTQFSMQDLVDTVNNSEESAASMATETLEEIQNNVAPGSFRIIFPFNYSDQLNHYLSPKSLPSVDGGTGVALLNKRATNIMHVGKPAIINNTAYASEDLVIPEEWLEWTAFPTITFPTSNYPLVGLWRVTVNLELACMAINTIGAPINTQVWLRGATTGTWDDTGNLRNTSAWPNPDPDIGQPEKITYIDGHVFEATTAQLITQADSTTMGTPWSASNIDKDILVHRIQNEVIVNTNTDTEFQIMIMSHGGTGAGPGGSHVIFTGIRSLWDHEQPFAGMVSINGVPTFGNPITASNHSLQTLYGGGGGAGFISFEWLGVAEEPAATGYYYDGDAIGEGNL